MCIATQQQPETAEEILVTMSCDFQTTVKDASSSQHTQETQSMSDMSSSSMSESSSKNTPLPTPSRPDPVIVTGAKTCVEDHYRVLPKVLGSGHYGVVRKCIDRRTRQRLAIKSIDKSKIENFDMLKREIDILQQLDHPGIVRMHDVHEDEHYLHIITELCEGGELFDRISDNYREGEQLYSEHEAAKLLQSILEAVNYCHENNVAHRDIKPENFIFTSKNKDTQIKLIDFGLARRHNSSVDSNLSDFVGTPYYMAPEILDRDHTAACDMWSVGVVAYILLVGFPPFFGSDDEIFESIRRGQFDLSGSPWDQISDSAKDFICALMTQNVNQRLTAKQAMDHPWMQQQLLKQRKRTSIELFQQQELESEIPESPRKKFKEDAILFDYEVSKADVESIRCLLTDFEPIKSGENYTMSCRPVVTPTIE